MSEEQEYEEGWFGRHWKLVIVIEILVIEPIAAIAFIWIGIPFIFFAGNLFVIAIIGYIAFWCVLWWLYFDLTAKPEEKTPEITVQVILGDVVIDDQTT